jgi:hypothetical protein
VVSLPEDVYSHELKLDRALHHLNSLQAEVQGWLTGNPYRLVKEFDAQRGEHVVRVEILDEPPATFGLIVGDCLHNLRSALDNLVYELAVAHSGFPLSKSIEGDSAFPILKNQDAFASKGKRMIRGIHPAAQTIIEQLQPYQRRQGFTFDDVTVNPLSMLNELSRIDKHRLPHLMLFGGGGGGFTEDVWARMASVTLGQFGPIESGTEMIRYRTLDAEDEVDVDFGFPFTIAFEQGPPGYGQLVTPILAGLRGYIIDEVVPPLRPFLRCH